MGNNRSAAILLGIFVCLHAAAQTDSLSLELGRSVVVSRRNTSGLAGRTSGILTLDSTLVRSLPRGFGSPDLVRGTYLLPGVSANADYDSGIRVDGCESSHNNISIDGVPIYGANHMIGIFSVFNASHFPSASFSHSSEGVSRLGGSLTMHLPEGAPKTASDSPAALSGDLETGLMLSQATLRVGLDSLGSGLILSGRQSYINMLYGDYLLLYGQPLRYGLRDINATVFLRPDSRNSLTANFYYGRDNTSARYGGDGAFDGIWGNTIGSVSWTRRGKHETTRTAYWSGYALDGAIAFPDSELKFKSSIGTAGYRAETSFRGFRFAWDASFSDILPQAHGRADSEETQMQRCFEGGLFSSWNRSVGDYLVGASLRLSGYVSPEGKLIPAADPSASLSRFFAGVGTLGIRGGAASQFLSQTGPNDSGALTDFYIPAGRIAPVQRSVWFHAFYENSFCQDALALSAKAYFKKLDGQLEYNAALFDLTSGAYSLKNCLLVGAGRNYGADICLQKRSGALTGWISYAYSQALRNFPEIESGIYNVTPGKWYHSRHERENEIDAVVSWRLNDRWQLGAVFIYASGSPFTMPDSYYMVAGHVLCHYGEFNSGRLPAYSRLDLSASLKLKVGSLNFSLYNALGRENVHGWMTSVGPDGVTMQATGLSFNFIPSLSYAVSFR